MAYSLCFTDSHLSSTHLNWAFLSATHGNSTHLGNQRTSSCHLSVLVLLIRSMHVTAYHFSFLKCLLGDFLTYFLQGLRYSPGDLTKSDRNKSGFYPELSPGLKTQLSNCLLLSYIHMENSIPVVLISLKSSTSIYMVAESSNTEVISNFSFSHLHHI